MREVKHCPRCSEIKPREAFAKNRARHDGLQSNCRECYKEHSVRQYARNRDRVLERSRRHHLENKERRNERSREWVRQNKQRQAELTRRWSANNRERRREGARRRYRENPESGTAQTAAYRAQKKQAIPAWADLEEIKKIYAVAAGLGLEVDHVVPLQSKLVCGLHCEANLRAVPRAVNRTKCNVFWPDMWD